MKSNASKNALRYFSANIRLFWNINNRIFYRSRARNKPARFVIEQAMKENPELKVTLPVETDDSLLDGLL